MCQELCQEVCQELCQEVCWHCANNCAQLCQDAVPRILVSIYNEIGSQANPLDIATFRVRNGVTNPPTTVSTVPTTVPTTVPRPVSTTVPRSEPRSWHSIKKGRRVGQFFWRKRQTSGYIHFFLRSWIG